MLTKLQPNSFWSKTPCLLFASRQAVTMFAEQMPCSLKRETLRIAMGQLWCTTAWGNGTRTLGY